MEYDALFSIAVLLLIIARAFYTYLKDDIASLSRKCFSNMINLLFGIAITYLSAILGISAVIVAFSSMLPFQNLAGPGAIVGILGLIAIVSIGPICVSLFGRAIHSPEIANDLRNLDLTYFAPLMAVTIWEIARSNLSEMTVFGLFVLILVFSAPIYFAIERVRKSPAIEFKEHSLKSPGKSYASYPSGIGVALFLAYNIALLVLILANA